MIFSGTKLQFIQRAILFLLAVCFWVGCTVDTQESEFPRTTLFDADWRFHRGDISDAALPEFEDSAWRKIDLPHDWSIEDLPGTNSPFDPEAINGVSVGFTVGGTGWYRKTFTIPASLKDKRVIMQFDGVYMNSDVWLNGQHIGNHPYGYTSFWFDITDKIKPGEENVIAVEVKNEGENSRWYSGSGIYRHVWLKVLEPVHVAQWGTYVTTSGVSEKSAKISAHTEVQNESNEDLNIRLVTRILDAKGEQKAEIESEEAIDAGGSYTFDQNISLQSPDLWSVELPSLYTMVSEVYQKNKLVDHIETDFGIRSLSFDAKNGFLLNGKPLLLKGGCVHHDNGPLGAKAYDRAEERKVELLKASGFNAVRCAHNPPSPAFLDACDRLGMLVIDEAFDTWSEKKNREDYNVYFDEWWEKDVKSMVLRDRNHPSVIMWSTGNEIPNRHKPEVAETAKMLANYIRDLDPSRPVTNGVNGIEENKDLFLASLDVAGYNYARDKYVPEHERVPYRVVYGSESFSIEAFEYWMDVVDHPWVIGDFVWTAFDHLGEASIGWLGYKQSKDFYPWNLAFVGDIDICGWKRPQSYYRDAVWDNGQNVSVFVQPPTPTFDETNPNPAPWSNWKWHDVVADWSWNGYEDKPLEVQVYSSCEQVELLLNGKSLGKKPTNRATKFMATWDVPYQAGELKAIAYNGEKTAATAKLHTAEEPREIKLSADRATIKANNQDLSYITVTLVDENGVPNTKSENLIKFELEGPGTIVGVGNANPKSAESFQQPQRHAWQGRCLVIVKSTKSTGKIQLKASADGVKSATLAITSK